MLAAKIQQVAMKECAGYDVAIVLKDKKSNWGEIACTCSDDEAVRMMLGALRHIKSGRPEIEPDKEEYASE